MAFAVVKCFPEFGRSAIRESAAFNVPCFVGADAAVSNRPEGLAVFSFTVRLQTLWFQRDVELPSEWLLKLLPNSTGVYLRRIKEPPDCRNAL